MCLTAIHFRPFEYLFPVLVVDSIFTSLFVSPHLSSISLCPSAPRPLCLFSPLLQVEGTSRNSSHLISDIKPLIAGYSCTYLSLLLEQNTKLLFYNSHHGSRSQLRSPFSSTQSNRYHGANSRASSYFEAAEHPLHHGRPVSSATLEDAQPQIADQDPKSRQAGRRCRGIRFSVLSLAIMRALPYVDGIWSIALQDRIIRQCVLNRPECPYICTLSASSGIRDHVGGQDAFYRGAVAWIREPIDE